MAARFKTLLRKWRGKRSQTQAAAKLGVPVSTYRNWEQGRRCPAAIVQRSILK